MVEKSLKVSDNSVIAIPLRNLIAIIELDLQMKDIELNSEFRIKWPRGEMGSLPDDARQDMKIEMLEQEVTKLKDNRDEE